MKIRVLVVLLVISAGAALAGPMSVQVRNCKVRATPSQLGSVVATVDYGAVVQAGTPQKGWYPVTTAGRQDRLAARVGPLQESRSPCVRARATPPPVSRPMKSLWRARASTSRSRPSSGARESSTTPGWTGCRRSTPVRTRSDNSGRKAICREVTNERITIHDLRFRFQSDGRSWCLMTTSCGRGAVLRLRGGRRGGRRDCGRRPA